MKRTVICAGLLFIFSSCAEVGEEYLDTSVDITDTDPLEFPFPDGIDLPPDQTDVPVEIYDGPLDMPVEETADVPVETSDTADSPDIVDVGPEDVVVDDTPTDPGPGTCTASDFPTQTMCNAGNKCTLGTSTGCTPDAICDLSGPQGENDICTGSSESDNCTLAYICLGDGVENRCRKFCRTDLDCHGGNSGCIIGITTPTCPDGLTGVNVCSHPCDYFYQTGCQSGQACRFVVPSGSFTAYSDCTAAGSGTQDSSCLNGSTDCASGYDCFEVSDGTITELKCLKICNYSGGYPSCDSGYTCSRASEWPASIGACL